MCGIVGYIGKSKFPLDSNLDLINHRGPDSRGTHYHRLGKSYIGIGHVRLSIVDLTSRANQPFFSNDGNYIIIYNGEIYNLDSLRADLEKKGYAFRSKSDTEVLLNMYIQYGYKLFEHLDGMYAFSILDLQKKRLICARDHLGIKPLYYYYNKRDYIFCFASELRALFYFDSVPKTVSQRDITEFLFNGWLYEPNTGYSDILKVPPGNFLSINIENFSIKQTEYFNLSKSRQVSNSVEELVRESIELQSRCEVNTGLFFSGGLDSTVLADQLRYSINAITVKYNKDELVAGGITDDYFYAEQIARLFGLNLEVEKFVLTNQNREEIIKQIKSTCEGVEELISDFTYISSERISERAKKRGYKVVLSGMGADELFLGYPRYKLVKYRQFFKLFFPIALIFRSLINKFKSLSKKIDRYLAFCRENNFGMAYSNLIGYFSKEEISRLVKDENTITSYNEKINGLLKNVRGFPDIKKAMYLDLYGFLSHNFIVADKSSMKNSIELRVPLATKKIAVKNFHDDSANSIDLFNYKKSLKNILKNKLPRKIINRKKAGFNPPMDEMITILGKDTLIGIFNEGNIEEYLNTDYAFELIERHFNNFENNTFKIWQLLYLNYWLKYANS